MTLNKKFFIACLAVYTFFIYSTLPYMPHVYRDAQKFFGKNFIPILNVFSVAVILSIVITTVKNVKRDRIFVFLGVIMTILAYIYLAGNYKLLLAEKAHLFSYALVAYLTIRIYDDVKLAPLHYMLIILTVTIIGFFDEYLQKFIPSRVYAVKDMLLNFISGYFGIILVLIIRYGSGEKSSDSGRRRS